DGAGKETKKIFQWVAPPPPRRPPQTLKSPRPPAPNTPAPQTRGKKARHRLHIVAAGKHVGHERVVICPQMILQQSFEYAAHVDGRLEVAVLQQAATAAPAAWSSALA